MTSVSERLTRLESTVHQQSETLAHIARTLEQLQESAVTARLPHWNVIFPAVALILTVVGAEWAMAIRPISQEQARVGMDLAEIRRLVVDADRHGRDLQLNIERNALRVEEMDRLQRQVYDLGSPITRERLAVIDTELKRLTESKAR